MDNLGAAFFIGIVLFVALESKIDKMNARLERVEHKLLSNGNG